MSPYYPIELDLRGRKALVVGLGAVGRRKAAGLAEAGARVLGVDPAAVGDELIREMASTVEVQAEPYRAEHMEGASLAFASATPEVNRRVLADARRAGVWACSASDPGAGDFRVPAVRRDGPLTVTVATSGASPALARALCERAAGALGPAAAGLVALLAEFRPRVFARLDDPDARRRLLTDWADPRWLDLWGRDGPGAVRRALERALDDAADRPHPTPPDCGLPSTRPCKKADPH